MSSFNAIALYKLDPNKDGQLTSEEIQGISVPDSQGGMEDVVRRLAGNINQEDKSKLLTQANQQGGSIKYFAGCDINFDGQPDSGVCGNFSAIDPNRQQPLLVAGLLSLNSYNQDFVAVTPNPIGSITNIIGVDLGGTGHFSGLVSLNGHSYVSIDTNFNRKVNHVFLPDDLDLLLSYDHMVAQDPLSRDFTSNLMQVGITRDYQGNYLRNDSPISEFETMLLVSENRFLRQVYCMGSSFNLDTARTNFEAQSLYPLPYYNDPLSFDPARREWGFIYWPEGAIDYRAGIINNVRCLDAQSGKIVFVNVGFDGTVTRNS